MPLLLAPFVAALLGVLLGLVGRDEVRRSSLPVPSTRGFLIVVLVSVLLLGPALGYFALFYADWSYGYLVPGTSVPSAITLLEILAAMAIAPATFTWTAVTLRRHAMRELVRGAGALVVLSAVAMALLGARLLVSCSYDDFREGRDLQPLAGSSLGLSILWVDAWLALGTLWAALRLRAVAR